jgi:hypothetical protein
LNVKKDIIYIIDCVSGNNGRSEREVSEPNAGEEPSREQQVTSHQAKIFKVNTSSIIQHSFG